MTVEHRENCDCGPELATGTESAAESELLRRGVAQLRQTMQTQPVIDEARGMVMAMGPCTAQEAWGVLVEVSQHTNVVKLRVAAGHVTAVASGHALPVAVRRALSLALQARRRR